MCVFWGTHLLIVSIIGILGHNTRVRLLRDPSLQYYRNTSQQYHRNTRPQHMCASCEGRLLIVSLLACRLSLPMNKTCAANTQSVWGGKIQSKDIFLHCSLEAFSGWLVEWSWSRWSLPKVNGSFEHPHPSLLWANISTIHQHAWE